MAHQAVTTLLRKAVWCTVLLLSSMTQTNAQPLRMLCLGDSYTIGEAVDEAERFPNQTADLLRDRSFNVDRLRIIATTGWTTDELQKAIDEANVSETYDVVTLLIGVNNQYRGRDIENYKVEFTGLLQQALQFANGKPDRVFVLSIPDWSVTPFAKDRDGSKIAEEIDAFNAVNRELSRQAGVHYLDITPVSRGAVSDNALVASDGLHPSGKMYGLWAAMLAPMVAQALKR
jgi:lysophospholipase L1-like esterase